jgi:hypothetical protein
MLRGPNQRILNRCDTYDKLEKSIHTNIRRCEKESDTMGDTDVDGRIVWNRIFKKYMTWNVDWIYLPPNWVFCWGLVNTVSKMTGNSRTSWETINFLMTLVLRHNSGILRVQCILMLRHIQLRHPSCSVHSHSQAHTAQASFMFSAFSCSGTCSSGILHV